MSLRSLCEGKEWAKQFTCNMFSWVTGIETKMLLIIFLGLIATLTSVSRGCEIGPQSVKNFDFYKVCIIVMTQFLKQAVFKTATSAL